jgi:intein/homing endonuclease
MQLATPPQAELVDDIIAKLSDPMWRLCSGALYKIIIKGDDPSDDMVIPFKPNRAQRRFIKRMWHRNIILKARQLGFTTLIAIIWLDHALFNANARCGIIAQDKGAAEVIFRDKVRFAYDNLPDNVRAMFPLKRDSASELLFAHNNSSIRVATSLRSGTIHRLHVSEFGKICKQFPEKAREVVTGSIPAVPASGILVIESTAEGTEGYFHDMTQAAMALQQSGKRLNEKDYRMHFFAWWENPDYSMPVDGIVIPPKYRAYFLKVEAEIGKKLRPEQRAWYMATLTTDFSGADELMWQEYPSTCVAGDTYVSTPHGMTRIKDVEPDGSTIMNWMDQGIRDVFRVRTRLGYTLVCTADHRLLCADGEYRRLDEVAVGQSLRMAQPSFGRDVQTIEYAGGAPFVQNTVNISRDFALFLGFIMGDGSFHDGTLSIACDAGDADTIKAVEALMVRFLGGAGSRVTGSKMGCVELRKAGTAFKEPLLALGVIEHRASGGVKRRVHVPEYIMRSPREVCASFLMGLFEADGFAARDGCSIKFFSKYEHVCLDVQRLLLAFGIESRVSVQSKKAGNGTVYEGCELVLRADGVRKFAREIGFVSARKQQRAELSLSKRRTGSNAEFEWEDQIVSIDSAGKDHVYDITTNTSNFIAGGIVVHNCKEAFQQSTEGCYYANQLATARKTGRILRIPQLSIPVNTFWDVGNSDGCAIWFHQKVGMEHRFIKYYEEHGEDLSHYMKVLQDTGFIWNKHFLPHDAQHERLSDGNRSIEQMLNDLGLTNTVIVPRIDSIQAGIQMTREHFPKAFIDEQECALGVQRLENYKKRWNAQQGRWGDLPAHDINSEGADAFRQWAQAEDGGLITQAGSSGFKRKSPGNWRTA